ncbi:hypothetical protein Tfer_1868 [Thermincola ferriacetica]|uniref:Uncharacterized protein n=1 Tax=Thermincola ferriacetica TaxID=281456 RepID=A0A0L6W1U7_9FIRM|nr:hypothetical protein [Thermincola ferriacetica]KNZ69426.1 hypothetical protein Tfer_1868 [Thermincola ferriacetica]
MKDRLTAGALAGFIGATIQVIFDITMKMLKITDRTFIDFAKVFVMFKPFKGVTADIVGTIGHLGAGALFGVMLAYIIMLTSHRFYLFKGTGFGFVIWITVNGIGTAINLPLFKEIPPLSALATLAGALIWGLVTAYILKLMDTKIRLV